MASRWFGFPRQVNEISARLVAAGVVLQGVVYLLTRQWWVLVPLVYGFLARVVAGPRYSPLGQFVTRIVTPRLTSIQPKIVPGPPKRFAQSVGLVFSGGALLSVALGSTTVAVVLIAGLVIAATLESAFAICLGCLMFAQLMKVGVLPESVCVECADISARLASANS